MSVELARVRLRGIYAVVAGGLILLGIPLFQSAFLAPTGYVAAADAASQRGDFGPLLAWMAAYSGSEVAFHLLEIAPFLLALPLPLNLWRVVRPGTANGTRKSPWVYAGTAGFACYALATAIGTVTSVRAAGEYASGQRGSATAGFAIVFGAQNLLAHVLGGLLLAAFLVAAGITIRKSPAVPGLLGYFAWLTALLLAITALLFATGPAQVEVATGPLSFAALALWLVGMGIILARLRALPGAEMSAPERDASASRDSSGVDLTRQ